VSFAQPRYEVGRPAPEDLWCTAGTPGGRTPLDIHVHSGVEVGIVLEGEEEIHFAGLILKCHRGHVWLCNAWEPHGWRITDPQTRIVVVIFTPEFVGRESVAGVPWFAPFAVPPPLRPGMSSAPRRQRVCVIGESLAKEIGEKSGFWQEMVRLDLLRLLLELTRDWEYREVPNLGPSRGVDAGTLSRLMPALAAVHASPWKMVHAAEAAAASGLSVSRFRWLFKQVTGMTFGQFCLRSRLSYASRQLLRTTRPLSAIAAEAGFVDASHLHHRFIEEYGCTPAQYRKQNGVVAPPGAPAGEKRRPARPSRPRRLAAASRAPAAGGATSASAEGRAPRCGPGRRSR
jgi:AraC-like DNA-binding protein